MSANQAGINDKVMQTTVTAAFSGLMPKSTMHKKCRKNVKFLRHSVEVKFQERR